MSDVRPIVEIRFAHDWERRLNALQGVDTIRAALGLKALQFARRVLGPTAAVKLAPERLRDAMERLGIPERPTEYPGHEWWGWR